MNYRVQVDIDAKGGDAARRSLADVDGALNSVGKTAAGVFVGNVLASGFGAIVSGAGQAAREILRYSAALEQSKVGFTTLIGNAGTAAKLLKDLQSFSVSTPFGLEAWTKVSQRMISVGIEGGKIVPLLRDIGNLVAATGDVSEERLSGITTALTQMISKTRVSAEEMEQLAERGVPAWKILSEAIGKTQAETRKMAEQGRISADVMISALQRMSRERFGDAMQKQSETFAGSLNVVKNLLTQFAVTAFEPVFKSARSWLTQLAANLRGQANSERNGFERIGFSIGEMVGQGLRNYFTSSSWRDILRDAANLGWRLGNPLGDGIPRAVIDGIVQGAGGGGQLLRDAANLGYRLWNPFGDGLPRVADGILAGGGGQVQRPPRTPDYRRPGDNQSPSTSPSPAADGGNTAARNIERARKEAEDLVKRSLSAGIQYWKNQIDLYRSQFQDALESMKRSFERTGDEAVYRSGMERAGELMRTLSAEAMAELEKLENRQAEKDKKGAAENAVLGQERLQRATEIDKLIADGAADSERTMADRRIKLAEEGAAREIEIIKGVTAERLAQFELERDRGLLSEKQYQQRIAIERLGAIEDEKKSLQKLLELKELDIDKRADLIHRIKVLDNELAVQQIKNAQAIEGAIAKEADEVKRVGDEIEALWKKMAQERDRAMHAEAGGSSAGPAAKGILNGILGNVDDWPGQANVVLGVNQMLTESFSQMAQAIGASVQAFVLFGSAGGSFRQFAAEMLASIAQMAAVQAVWNLAEGFAKLALAYFGHPTAGPSATQHFIAAAVYGTIAGVAAGAGRAVAGNSAKSGTSGDSTADRPDYYTSNPSGSLRSGTVPPQQSGISRQVEGLTAAVDGLNRKISGMRPGDVLTAGARERRGFLTETVTSELNQNPTQVGRLGRAMNLR